MVSRTKNFLCRALIFLGIAILWYLYRRREPPYYISKGIFEMWILLFSVMMAEVGVWISRYYMPFVTCNNFSGSVLDRPALIKDKFGTYWAVFNTGAHLYPVPGKGKLATLVIPFQQLNRAGRNYVAKTFARRVQARHLPPAVYDFISHSSKDFNLQRVFFGKFSEEFMHSDDFRQDQESMLQALHAEVNDRSDLLEKKHDLIVDYVQFGREVSGTKKSIFSLFKPKEKEPDEE